VFSIFIGALIYPLFGNWVWGGGWLSQLGTNLHLGHGDVDFAGSSVVHMTGGVLALVGGALLGPREQELFHRVNQNFQKINRIMFSHRDYALLTRRGGRDDS